jgi:hypothetical protein
VYYEGYNNCGTTAPGGCAYAGEWGPASGGDYSDEFDLTGLLNGGEVWDFTVSNAFGGGFTPSYTFYTDADGLDNCTTLDPGCDDVDEDGICDDEDDCVGVYDECGVCNGDGSSCIDCCETELTWNLELTDYTVECVEDLPGSCEDFATDVMAVNECDGSEYEAVCFIRRTSNLNKLCARVKPRRPSVILNSAKANTTPQTRLSAFTV